MQPKTKSQLNGLAFFVSAALVIVGMDVAGFTDLTNAAWWSFIVDELVSGRGVPEDVWHSLILAALVGMVVVTTIHLIERKLRGSSS